jgi:arabinogalactan oligomer / maltooligosaccharide transport system permease protein
MTADPGAPRQDASPAGTRRRPPSHRWRFLAGVAAAAALAVGLGGYLAHRAAAADREQQAERSAVITLSALADLVESASLPTEEVTAGGGGINDELAGLGVEPPAETPPADESGETEGGGLGIGDELAALDAAAEGDEPAADGLPQTVRLFAERHRDVEAVRVVFFDGQRLAASTAPADTGDKAAPRRLARDEKPLYDLGQILRAAVDANREEGAGAARQREVATQRRADVLVLTAPVERDTAVVGLVQIETPAPPGLPGAGRVLLQALLAAAAAGLVFWLLSRLLGERRWALAAAAVLLLLATLVLFGQRTLDSLESGRRASEQAVAAHVATEQASAREVLAATGGAASALNPALWDVDAFRRPRGLAATADAAAARQLLDRQIAAGGRRFTRALAVCGLLGLVLLAFVGLGGASRVGADLVEYRVAYSYILPALFGMLVLVFFPFFYGIALSFTNSNIYNSDQPVWETWVGLENYKDILGDFSLVERTPDGLVWDYQNFYWTLGFTVVWTVTNVALGVTLGLVLALLLNTKGLALRPVYRVLLILPWALPNYITALIWKGMFHPQFGVINQMIQLFGGTPIAWFDRPLTSFLAVLATNSWLSFPFMMVISLGALQSISADLYEAARVDGASRWQQFRSITLPSLRPALVPAVILSVIWTFNMFNIIFLVSAGEPSHSTEILITQAYKLAFEQYRYGYAAAYSVVIFLILFAYGTWQNRVTKGTEAVA